MKKIHDVHEQIAAKKYKKHTLKKRLSRWMNVSNSVSVLFILITMIIMISALVAFMGSAFSQAIAKQLAENLSYKYVEAESKRDFINEAGDVDNDLISDDLVNEMEIMMTAEEATFIEAEIINEELSFFEYKIIIDGRVEYDSFEGGHLSSIDKMNRNNMNAVKAFSEKEATILDEQQNVVATVAVRISPDMISIIVALSIGLAIIVLIVNGIISKIITFIMSRVVSKPLEVLAEQMESISNDELEDAFNREINVKRPISEVKSLTDSTTKIMTKMAHYYELMTAQNEELEAQRDELESQRDEVEAQNHELAETSQTLQSMNGAYLNRTLKLQNFLDNVGQGFLTFDEDLLINDEYSLACQNILCEEDHTQDLKGQKITELLFEGEDQQDFIESLIVKILNGTEHERELFMPLLPEEVMLNGSIQEVDYKIVRNELFKEQMMVILTDISDKRALEEQMEEERDVLQMIVKVLTNRDDFIDMVEGFKTFLYTPFSAYTEEDFEEVLRSIHTFKGSFSQYYMSNISWTLNEIENQLYEEDGMRKMLQLNNPSVLLALKNDLEVIEQYVGENFFEQKDIYTVREEKIIEIEQRIKDILPATEFNKVMPIIKSIRYKSVKEGLRSYPDYVMKLSDRMGKSIKAFEITGDDVFVDFEVYQPLFKSLVHIFRNAVDHGVEDPDLRITNDKQEMAEINCHIHQIDLNNFQIVIEDDGAGIDVSKVLETAVAKGVITSDEAINLSIEGVMDLIFTQGVTTKETANAISGRGVGLAAARNQVNRLGGTIKLSSEANKGSKFLITLPIIQGADIIVVEPASFMDRVESSAKQYFTSLGLSIGEGIVESVNQMTLHRVSAIINIKGSIDGLLVISVNEETSKAMVKAFVIEELRDEEVSDYMEDVLGEVTNTILGNVLGILEEDGIYLTIGVPAMLSNEKAYIKYMDRQIMTSQHSHNDLIVTISLLVTESDAEYQNLTFDIEN